MDRLIAGMIFTAVLGMAAILLLIGFTEAPQNAAGVAHGEIPAMLIGGDGAARLADIGGLAFVFNCLLLLFTVLLCTLSVSPDKRTPVFFGWMTAVFVTNLIVWQQMYFGHLAFLASGETGWFLGFPAATAWQVYGVWFAGVILIAVYSGGFRSYILSESDERRFERLLREARTDAEPDFSGERISESRR